MSGSRDEDNGADHSLNWTKAEENVKGVDQFYSESPVDMWQTIPAHRGGLPAGTFLIVRFLIES